MADLWAPYWLDSFQLWDLPQAPSKYFDSVLTTAAMAVPASLPTTHPAQQVLSMQPGDYIQFENFNETTAFQQRVALWTNVSTLEADDTYRPIITWMPDGTTLECALAYNPQLQTLQFQDAFGTRIPGTPGIVGDLSLEWVFLEARVNLAPSFTGEVELYVDGTLFIDETGVSTSTAQIGSKYIRIGGYNVPSYFLDLMSWEGSVMAPRLPYMYSILPQGVGEAAQWTPGLAAQVNEPPPGGHDADGTFNSVAAQDSIDSFDNTLLDGVEDVHFLQQCLVSRIDTGNGWVCGSHYYNVNEAQAQAGKQYTCDNTAYAFFHQPWGKDDTQPTGDERWTRDKVNGNNWGYRTHLAVEG